MYQEEYKRWLAADLQDADLNPELSKIEVLIIMQMIHMRAVKTPMRIKSFAFSFCFILLPPHNKM